MPSGTSWQHHLKTKSSQKVTHKFASICRQNTSTHHQKEGWNLQLQKTLSEIRLLFAMQNLCAELIISRYKTKVNSGFSLTKRDFYLQNGKEVYKKRVSFSKCNFWFYKRDSRATSHQENGNIIDEWKINGYN